MLHSISQQICKTQQWPQDWKRSVFISMPKKDNAKEWSNYHTIAVISHTSNVMLKILQAGLQQYVNCKILHVQAEIKLQTSVGSLKKTTEFQKKHLLLLYWLCQSLWLHGLQQTWKFFKRWEYQTILPDSWETCMQVKKQPLERTWNNGLVQNWERSTSRLYIVTLLI